MRSFVGGVLDAGRSLRNRVPVPYVGRSGGLSSLILGRNTFETQMRAYGSLGVLFQIVSRCANSTALPEWGLWRKAASGMKEDRKPVTRHAALDVWNKPNDFYTRQELIESIQQHVDLTGEGWPIIYRNVFGLPQEIWPARPDRMEPVRSRELFIAGYVYTSPDGEKVPLERQDVMMLRMPNPLDPHRGIGPVQALMVDIDSARYTAEWNRNFFLNSAEPGGIIEVPTMLGDTQFKLLNERWREQHQGVSQAHRVAILEVGKWVDRKYTMRDMQFAELRELSDETIRKAFGFPKPLLGSVDDVNRANAEAAEVVFGRWLVRPRLERWKQLLNNDFLPMFGRAAEGLEFDYEDPTPADRAAEMAELTAKVDAVVKLLAAGVEMESACAVCGLPEMVLDAARMASMVGGGGTQQEDPESDTEEMQEVQNIATIVQKLCAGVDRVLTWEESRALLSRAGVQLNAALARPTSTALAVPGTGALALRGERGPRGERGEAPSAAEVANHLIAHHRDDLRGEPGAPGRDGEPGARGERGPVGPPPPVDDVVARLVANHGDRLRGEVGQRGERGPAGSSGAPGAAGPAGPAGPAGERGPAGRSASADGVAVPAWWMATTPVEQHAGTARVIQEHWQSALDDLMDDWRPIVAAQRAQLATQIQTAVDRGDREALSGLTVSTRDSEETLTAAMVAIAVIGSDEVANEATTQGVPEATPAEVSHHELESIAVVVAGLLGSSLANAAGRRALQVLSPDATGAEVARDVTEHLEGLSDRYLLDNLGGALTQAQNTGRFSTMQAIEDSGVDCRYIAIETNDAVMCAPCGRINGHEYDTVQDARNDYPTTGFKDCLGGPRCRGTAVPIFDASKARAERKAEVPKAARPYHNDLDGIGPLANTARGSRAGTTEWTNLTGGMSSDTRLGRLADGRKIVQKRPPSWGDVADNKHQADAEQLAARMAQRLGIRTAGVYRDAVDRVYMEYVEGKTVAELGESMGARLAQEARVASMEGRRLGLLDVLIGNGDRNAGNMIIAEDGTMVGIDHGAAWVDHVLGNPARAMAVDGSILEPSWNYARLVGGDARWVANDLTEADVTEIRRRLESLRADFELVGRGDWLDYSLSMLDELARHASGAEGGSIFSG